MWSRGVSLGSARAPVAVCGCAAQMEALASAADSTSSMPAVGRFVVGGPDGAYRGGGSHGIGGGGFMVALVGRGGTGSDGWEDLFEIGSGGGTGAGAGAVGCISLHMCPCAKPLVERHSSQQCVKPLTTTYVESTRPEQVVQSWGSSLSEEAAGGVLADSRCA